MSSLATTIRTACLLEAAAPKPGNVHPVAAFEDMTYADLVASADAVAEILAEAAGGAVGRAVLDAVVATRQAVGSNTNLGIILLLAPLAAVPAEEPLDSGINKVLAGLTADDARRVYEAIRTANPAGLGRVDAHDVADAPDVPLLEAMRAAADRDAVAGCYVDGFADVLRYSREWLPRGDAFADGWDQHVVGLALKLLAEKPDSLIARKCGEEVAAEATGRARDVLDSGWPRSSAGREGLRDLDAWLRADGHRRNPGTTADLVTATLFSALREKLITTPADPLFSTP